MKFNVGDINKSCQKFHDSTDTPAKSEEEQASL